MPRLARVVVSGIPLHVVHRGHNRDAVFHSTGDHQRYLQNLEELAEENRCAVHAYALMPNHVHILLTPADETATAMMMKRLAQDHAQFMNWKTRSVGAFWQGRFFSCPVDSDDYLFACYRYIELNAVRAGIVGTPGQFPWSSFRANSSGKDLTWLRPHANYDALGDNPAQRASAYLRLFDHALPEATLKAIRLATRTGAAFGSKAFCEKLERATGTTMMRAHRGRPRLPIVTTIK